MLSSIRVRFPCGAASEVLASHLRAPSHHQLWIQERDERGAGQEERRDPSPPASDAPAAQRAFESIAEQVGASVRQAVAALKGPTREHAAGADDEVVVGGGGAKYSHGRLLPYEVIVEELTAEHAPLAAHLGLGPVGPDAREHMLATSRLDSKADGKAFVRRAAPPTTPPRAKRRSDHSAAFSARSSERSCAANAARVRMSFTLAPRRAI